MPKRCMTRRERKMALSVHEGRVKYTTKEIIMPPQFPPNVTKPCRPPIPAQQAQPRFPSILTPAVKTGNAVSVSATGSGTVLSNSVPTRPFGKYLKQVYVSYQNQNWARKFEQTRGTCKFLCTGMQGGGTGFISQVIKSVGWNCGHENLFFGGGGQFRPPYHAESSWLIGPFIADTFFDGHVRIQITRHPIKVVQSNYNLGVGDINGLVNQYELWHNCIEKENKIDYRHRVEDDPTKLLKFMNAPYQGKVIFNNTSYNSHSRRSTATHLTVSDFNEVSVEKLKVLCNKYGYKLEGGLL